MCERAHTFFHRDYQGDGDVELGVEKLEAALRESLGVIVYAAAKYLHIEREMKRHEKEKENDE